MFVMMAYYDKYWILEIVHNSLFFCFKLGSSSILKLKGLLNWAQLMELVTS